MFYTVCNTAKWLPIQSAHTHCQESLLKLVTEHSVETSRIRREVWGMYDSRVGC